eukprot:2541439-Rhodomonas_salina.1
MTEQTVFPAVQQWPSCLPCVTCCRVLATVTATANSALEWRLLPLACNRRPLYLKAEGVENQLFRSLSSHWPISSPFH